MKIKIGRKTKKGKKDVFLSTKCPNILVTSSFRASGVTNLIKTWIDSFHKNGTKIIIFDPKLDYAKLDSNYKLVSVIPSFLSDNYTKAQKYSIIPQDFDVFLSDSKRMYAWCMFLSGVDEYGVGRNEEFACIWETLRRVLSKKPKNLSQMIKYISDDIIYQRQLVNEGHLTGVSTYLLHYFKMKIYTNEISHRDTLNEVTLLQNNDIVVYNTSCDRMTLNSLCVYMSIFLNKIIKNHIEEVKAMGKIKYLLIVVEDFDVFLGNRLIRDVFFSISTKYRHYGINIIASSKNPYRIKSHFGGVFSYICTGKICNSEMKNFLLEEGIDIEDFYSLDFDVKNPSNNQWILKSSSGEVLKFYPCKDFY